MKRIKAIILATIAAVIFETSAAFAGNLTIVATRLSQMTANSIYGTYMMVRSANVTSGANEASVCYHPAGIYEFYAVREDAHYKDMMALAALAFATGKRVNITAEESADVCKIREFTIYND
jgi:phosphotransferase system HPr-like phosphotransfer protein